MKKTIELKVPTDWSAVTLKQYLALKKDMETYKDNPDAITACLFHHLCNFPVEYLQQMDLDTFIAAKKDIYSFFNKANYGLKQFLKIGDVEYGFEPNLSQMAYGAYVDISKYESLGIDKNWASIMSILYRPVTNKLGALYDIKSYDGVINEELFLDVPMDVHFGALFFFKDLLTDLQNDTLKSLTELTELPDNIKSILLKNGNHTLPSFNWQEGILQKSKGL